VGEGGNVVGRGGGSEFMGTARRIYEFATEFDSLWVVPYKSFRIPEPKARPKRSTKKSMQLPSEAFTHGLVITGA
jgi:hypothetical protein